LKKRRGEDIRPASASEAAVERSRASINLQIKETAIALRTRIKPYRI